jgi:site-specific DNA recombinase
LRAERRERRCAVYTRKSSEEGLEQDFNSLDAQREACEAYIKSQAGEGWKLVRTRYDDGGYSGGSMVRPGLEQLLADIQDQALDTVVVYKVDRLTRSLADFAKIVEVFDANGVSFVSVTQQFNTTTSMGRLTLNMLLSFAQFEREVTGERIRDKIAASKQKGMWMGGPVPLGYEPNGRSLKVVEAEAETVRTIFQLYLELGSVRKLKDEADQRGLRTKLRPGADIRIRGGRPFSRGHLYRLLASPIYIGRVGHNGDSFEGQHPAIVDRETWDAVQAQMAANTRERSARARAIEPSPLKGKLFDESGVPLTPSHATKSGRRYRYYVSHAAIVGSCRSANPGPPNVWRIPAREIEERIADAVTALVADRAELARLARETEIEAEDVPELLHTVRDWRGAPLELVKCVELGRDEIAIGVDLSRFLNERDVAIRLVIPARIRRRGQEMRIVVESGRDGARARQPDAALIKAVVRAREWFEDLVSGRARTHDEIAKREGVTGRYVRHLMPLAFLAPDIVAAIVGGAQPVDLMTETLTKQTDLPLGWAEQRSLLSGQCEQNSINPATKAKAS